MERVCVKADAPASQRDIPNLDIPWSRSGYRLDAGELMWGKECTCSVVYRSLVSLMTCGFGTLKVIPRLPKELGDYDPATPSTTLLGSQRLAARGIV